MRESGYPRARLPGTGACAPRTIWPDSRTRWAR